MIEGNVSKHPIPMHKRIDDDDTSYPAKFLPIVTAADYECDNYQKDDAVVPVPDLKVYRGFPQ